MGEPEIDDENPYRAPEPMPGGSSPRGNWIADRAALLGCGCMSFAIFFAPVIAIALAVDYGVSPNQALAALVVVSAIASLAWQWPRRKAGLAVLAFVVVVGALGMWINAILPWLGVGFFLLACIAGLAILIRRRGMPRQLVTHTPRD